MEVGLKDIYISKISKNFKTSEEFWKYIEKKEQKYIDLKSIYFIVQELTEEDVKRLDFFKDLSLGELSYSLGGFAKKLRQNPLLTVTGCYFSGMGIVQIMKYFS